MNKQYFIIKDGAQQGPFGYEQLKQLAITRETFVWTSGMQEWEKAGDVPELAFIFGMPQEEESAFGGYARPEEPVAYNSAQKFNNWNTAPTQVPPHTNWLPWAITATVAGALFSCIGLIFGIIGITNASKANRLYMEGAVDAATTANSTARTMTIIALALAVVGIILVASGLSSEILMKLLENYQ